MLIILFLLFILTILLQPKLDRTADGYYIIWYNNIITQKRNFKILGKL